MRCALKRRLEIARKVRITFQEADTATRLAVKMVNQPVKPATMEAMIRVNRYSFMAKMAAMTAAVVAVFTAGRTTLRGIGSWRVKETDRIAAMATELRKLGATVEEGADRLSIVGTTGLREATIDTYDDHRIAMCFALAATGGVPVHIRDPRCVSKTFPRFFAELAALTAVSGAP